MRILFITATRIGDAVLSTGLLAHLLAAHPDARFTVACGPDAAGLFTHMPRLDRLLVVEKRRRDAHWPLLWARTVATRWHLVVDLRGSALSFLLPTARRAVMRGGRRPGHRLLHLAATLGLHPAPRPTVWCAPEDHALAASLVPANAVALGPTANWDGKIWPPERFATLVRALAPDLPGMRPVILAGPGPREATLAAAAQAALEAAGVSGTVDLAGRLTLPQAAACLARVRLFIGNDSGLMHLAAAAGAPTLGLFGPSAADEYAPAGARADVPTAVAGRPGPIANLSVADALAAARTLLGRAPAQPVHAA